MARVDHLNNRPLPKLPPSLFPVPCGPQVTKDDSSFRRSGEVCYQISQIYNKRVPCSPKMGTRATMASGISPAIWGKAMPTVLPKRRRRLRMDWLIVAFIVSLSSAFFLIEIADPSPLDVDAATMVSP